MSDDIAPAKCRSEELMAAVEQKLSDDSVAFRFGRKFLAHHDQARRIVFVPVGGAINPPKSAGSRRLGAAPGETEEPKVRILPTIAECVEQVDVYIYGEDFGATEALKDGVIAAISKAIGAAPSAVFARYVWASQESEEAGDTNRTELIVLTFTLALPVPEAFEPLRRVTGFTDVCGTIQPNGTVLPQQ